MNNDRMDIILDLNVFKQILLRVSEEEKAMAGAESMDKIVPWQARAHHGRPTTPPTGTNVDSKAIKLLTIKDMKLEILFKPTPDYVLYNFLQASENPTINKIHIMLHTFETLYFRVF
jgi:hypothetical protein